MNLVLHGASIAYWAASCKTFGLVMAGVGGYNAVMWRKVFCVITFLASLYLLMSAVMQAWLTAANPALVEYHRLWAYVFLGAALVMYAVFGVLLRPRSVLHFCLCTLAFPVAGYSFMRVQVSAGAGNALLLAVSGGYLLWRFVKLVQRLND